jgi:glycosyltransferase involved in cell wall biosynthesis
MAGAVCALLEDPQAAARMGLAGRARAEREFAATRQCAEIETVLLGMLTVQNLYGPRGLEDRVDV